MRTRGLAVASIVEVLLGLFALIGGVVHLLFGVGGLVSFSGTDVTLGALANALGDIFTVEGLILLVAGAALWRGATWGWKLSVGIIIVGIITSIPVLALGSVGAVPALLVNFGLLYYLGRRKVRDSFRTPRAIKGSEAAGGGKEGADRKLGEFLREKGPVRLLGPYEESGGRIFRALRRSGLSAVISS